MRIVELHHPIHVGQDVEVTTSLAVGSVLHDVSGPGIALEQISVVGPAAGGNGRRKFGRGGVEDGDGDEGQGQDVGAERRHLAQLRSVAGWQGRPAPLLLLGGNRGNGCNRRGVFMCRFPFIPIAGKKIRAGWASSHRNCRSSDLQTAALQMVSFSSNAIFGGGSHRPIPIAYCSP